MLNQNKVLLLYFKLRKNYYKKKVNLLYFRLRQNY